ncbi:helix-turn-helix transcriptional regulator [Actinoplanes sp. G11-F43]|uniref:helix-turn-helix transcriptional regulator n=1 Tax=Actinoplanes sp. G11-F43 TaxID=3424130 RepID=UPI003D3509D2
MGTPQHRALGSASRATIMRMVRAERGGLTAAEVAAETGQHLSTTRAHLDRLVAAGLLVKARASGGMPGRPAWRFRAAATDPAPAPYRALAMALLEDLQSGDRDGAARVGRDWGRRLAVHTTAADPADAVTDVLDGLGFAAVRDRSAPHAPERVLLRTCPFLDLVGRNPDAMCGLHAGMVRGVLDQRGADSEGTVLEPFGTSTACVVHLPPTLRPAGRAAS